MNVNSLLNKWKSRVPKYSETHKNLFESLAEKFGAEGEKRRSLGKQFSTNYELYIYAFFLGLYNNELIPITKEDKKIDFSHPIQNWGSKNKAYRKDFTVIQDYIFAALIAKTDIDVISLEKGEIDEEEIIKSLMETLESYTNGGLTILQEKNEENPNYFLQPTAFLDLILPEKVSDETNKRARIINSN